MTDVYACYLESSRRYRESIDQKKDREKTVQEAAAIVGLELPKTPAS
jgi:hypothetical protein